MHIKCSFKDYLEHLFVAFGVIGQDYYYRTTTIIFKHMRSNQQYLDALNILKACSYFQLMLQDTRAGLCQSKSINLEQVYQKIDTRGLNKVEPADLVQFMSVHRIAISERESEFLVWRTGSQNKHMDFENFQEYITVGDPQYITEMMTRSQSRHPARYADQVIKNYGEIQVAKVLEKEVEGYRTIEKLKEQFIKKHGFVFMNVVSLIDREKKGKIDFISLIEFMNRFGVQFSPAEFDALGRRVFSKETSVLSYKQVMKIFSPFEPLNFPTYRKENNFQRALNYINQEVAKLNINTQSIAFETENRAKTKTGFNKVMENYRNPENKTDGVNPKYFYDQNYYNQLKQYRTNFFNPNRDVKKRVQAQGIGPQYHDHFFSDYYLYLEEKNKLEHYYNKFGKRYTSEGSLSKTATRRA